MIRPMHRRTPRLAPPLARIAVAALCLTFAGCSDDIGDGRVVGSLIVPDCEEGRFVCSGDVPLEECSAFDLAVTFFALETTEDAARLTLQHGGQPFGHSDFLIFEIRDVRLLRGRLGQSLPVGPDANIRAGLGLFDRCPETTQSFELQGTITFTAFGVSAAERVAGTIDRLEVRDGRTETGPAGTVLGLLRGDFDFRVQVGPPYQRFSQ